MDFNEGELICVSVVLVYRRVALYLYNRSEKQLHSCLEPRRHTARDISCLENESEFSPRVDSYKSRKGLNS